MFRLIAAYNQPEDPETFLDHYRNVHIPIAKTMPDLKEIHWGTCVDPEGGTPDRFVVTTLDWETKEQALAALGSPEGQKGNEDLANFAQAGVSVYTVELEE